MDSLFTHNQSAIWDSSRLTEFEIAALELLPSMINEQVGHSSEVSSAYKINSNFSEALLTSFIYMIKSRGPRIEPWGTPVVMLILLE